MTAQRQAVDLCGRDRGRTIKCQSDGGPVVGVVQGVEHTATAVWVWIEGRFSAVRLKPEQLVEVAGAVVPA